MKRCLLWLVWGCVGFSQAAGLGALWITHSGAIEGGQWVEYTGVQRFEVAAAGLEALVAQLSRPARPARFVWDKQKGWMGVDKPGYRLNLAQLQSAYAGALAAGQNTFVIPAQVLEPKPSALELYRKGVLSLLAEGRTSFRGSLPSRIANIRRAAARFDGTLIAPQAVFSFSQTLGAVSYARGYQNAWVIAGNRTVWGIGGGVCQVATTAFRAAYFSGLPILQRRPHSYQVGYYQPTGLDATVAAGAPDLRFKNDTPAYIRIQTLVQGQELIFRFFGTKDRTVSWQGPFVYNRIPPPPTRYIYDASLRAGAYRQIDFSAWGADVYVYRRVQLSQGVRHDTLYSHYQPWGAVYLVGPRP